MQSFFQNDARSFPSSQTQVCLHYHTCLAPTVELDQLDLLSLQNLLLLYIIYSQIKRYLHISDRGWSLCHYFYGIGAFVRWIASDSHSFSLHSKFALCIVRASFRLLKRFSATIWIKKLRNLESCGLTALDFGHCNFALPSLKPKGKSLAIWYQRVLL